MHLTQQVCEPQGQILLHGQQVGLVSAGQPLAVLVHVGQAGPPRLGAQGSAHGSAAASTWETTEKEEKGEKKGLRYNK